MGWGSKIDPATGRKKRESGRLHKLAKREAAKMDREHKALERRYQQAQSRKKSWWN